MNTRIRWFALVAATLSLAPAGARAHCDTLDGPVVKTARGALETKDLRPVLAWVKRPYEGEVRSAFFKALSAGKAAPARRESAEREFLEAVVRVHRQGEGAPFTGLKPAGAGVGAAVREADVAAESGDAAGLEQRLADAVRHGVRERHERVAALQPPGKDVAAGRAWVEAYVDYVHYVERLDAAAGGTGHHGEIADEGSPSPSLGAAERSPSHGHAH
jgi:hypothetical protein